jgi:hypothetical protein
MRRRVLRADFEDLGGYDPVGRAYSRVKFEFRACGIGLSLRRLPRKFDSRGERSKG